MEMDQKNMARLPSFRLRSIMVNVYLSNAVSLRIRKKETFPFTLFEVHGDRSIEYDAFVVFGLFLSNAVSFTLWCA